jgi:hypothetical protein
MNKETDCCYSIINHKCLEYVPHCKRDVIVEKYSISILPVQLPHALFQLRLRATPHPDGATVNNAPLLDWCYTGKKSFKRSFFFSVYYKQGKSFCVWNQWFRNNFHWIRVESRLAGENQGFKFYRKRIWILLAKKVFTFLLCGNFCLQDLDPVSQTNWIRISNFFRFLLAIFVFLGLDPVPQTLLNLDSNHSGCGSGSDTP